MRIILGQVLHRQPVAELDAVALAAVGVQVEQNPAPALADDGLVRRQQEAVVLLPGACGHGIGAGAFEAIAVHVELGAVELVDDQMHRPARPSFELGRQLVGQFVGVGVVVDHRLAAIRNLLRPQRPTMRDGQDDRQVADLVLDVPAVPGDDLSGRVASAVHLI